MEENRVSQCLFYPRESRGALGSRALSHDSIFIPESGQDPTRPVRVFSQENVCDRIKALQLKIQCNVKMGPPPPPGGLPAKRGDDTGMSSEDDGLPRSPPEMSLHDIGPSTTIKVSLVSSSRPQSPDQLSSRHASDASVSPRTSDSSVAPVADFDYPPEFSSCLDNSAAKHKLLVKPRNQRSSKMRRLSSRAQSESLSDLTCTPEEEEYDDKSLPKVSTEENPNSAQQDVGLDRSPEPGGLATMLQSEGPRARRARLQHCPALSASAEEESFLGDNTSSRPATPEVIESESGPVPRAESPSLPEGSPHHHHNPDSEIQREEPSLESTSPPARETADEVICASGDMEIRLSPSIPEGDTTPPETDPAITSETPPGLDGPDQSVQKEVELTLEAPEPEGAGKGSPEAPAPSPSAPKSCLKHKAPAVSESPGAPAACEPPAEKPAPGPLDGEAEPPRAEPAEPPQGGPERLAPERKVERAGSELRAVKFSVSSGRAWPRSGSARLLEHAGPAGALPVRLPLLRSSLAWRSEAALDDLRAPPEPHGGGGSRDSGDAAAGPGRSPRDAPGDPCPAAREPTSGEDRGPFAVKLRSTSLSFKHREASSAEARGIKRYSAEIRLERGGLALLPKDEKCQVAKAPSPRGARSPHEQGKGKARPSEPLSSKPPLPRKPQLQSRPLPSPDAGPGELVKAALPQDLRRETRSAETRSQHRAAEKGPPPAAEGQPAPPWITIARQKRRGTPNQPPNQEDKPGVRTLKSEIGKQAKAPERAQEPMKQADFVRSKSFLIAPAKPTVDRRQGTKLRLQEGLQRGISLSHQNLAAQSAVMTEKELHQLKRASYASADQPSWMELARKKSQAWSDMPQIIK
uniref:CRACD-like protein n=1 Tax=Panthera onca TaxID=9690 RepID=UPI002954CA9E|nr:CRACD-like protein [Panthera onca]